MNLRAADTQALPRSRLRLTRLGMGCAPIGGRWRPVPEGGARAALDAAWDLGLRYFDTAPCDGFTRAELRLGAALRGRSRDEVVISTKAGRLMLLDNAVLPGTGGWADPLPFRPQNDYSYQGILRSHDDSVRRMGVGHIDILYVHDIGLRAHGELHQHYWRQLTRGGGFRALQSLRDEGRVSAIGLGVSEWEVVAAAMQECELDCTLLAGRYTLLEHAAPAAMLADCVRSGNAIVIGAPFNSGVLAGNGKYNDAGAAPEVLARVAAMAAVCREFDVPLAAAALQFPMAHPAVASCIPGARSAAQLRQNAAWFELPVPPQLWQALKQRGLIDGDAAVAAGT